ncbi:MAG: hypothetical protein H7Z41_12480, partial [Cytophagales bacterium]|nr:hypothetical protein [Armatimonadota bacterium]
YHSKERNVFQETFYGAKGFGLGSVALTMVDNPAQQTVWRLVCGDKDRALVFGGGQPRFRHPEGHSPYDQTLQKRGAMILLTGPTEAAPEGAVATSEQRSRLANAAGALVPGTAPDTAATAGSSALAAWWETAPQAAASWLFVPRAAQQILERENGIAIAAGEAFVVVRPIGGPPRWVRPSPPSIPDSMAVLRKYQILTVPAGTDGISGYVIEAVERDAYPSLERFADAALREKPRKDGATVRCRSLAGDDLVMTYQHAGLRATGSINGKQVDWAHWANDGVFDSPFIKIKNGQMTISDGRESYTLKG